MSLGEFVDDAGNRKVAGPLSPMPVCSGAPSFIPISVLSGAHITSAIDLAAARLHSILFPSGMPAVDITFDVSPDNSNFGALFTASGEYALPASVVGAGKLIAVDPSLFFAFRYFKIRTGTLGSVADQAAQRDLILLAVPR